MMPHKKFNAGNYLGVDVGTGSARAGIFNASGKLLGSASFPIELWRPQSDFVEQSSDNIWKMCGKAVRSALKQAHVPPETIHGIGFDATCSLVVLDQNDQPLTVSPTGRKNQNVIVWMDHRAMEQAQLINRTQHPVLKYVGNVISPEMQSPKLLWLMKHLPTTWKNAARFLDLPDFLTYRATGDDTRSSCTTVCKWTYQGHRQEAGWDASFFKRIGLEAFPKERFARIGTRIRPMGEPLGKGLTSAAAREFGLCPGTPVGVGIIDAHAGGLGILGCSLAGEKITPQILETRLALIGGTSSCHMAVSRKPHFIPGIWGPYHSAMIPGMWLTEGGQSATGALIDHVITTHSMFGELQKRAKNENHSIYESLNLHLDSMSERISFPACLTRHFHVLPYFHGNRSPRANPTLRGMVSGLKLSSSLDDLAILYLATIQAIAHGTRHIISEMNRKGHCIQKILACGGGTKNRYFLREHADITGCEVILAKEPESVLLGSAILGAVASQNFPDIQTCMGQMNQTGTRLKPSSANVRRYHDAKHRIFHRMYTDQIRYKKIMEPSA